LDSVTEYFFYARLFKEDPVRESELERIRLKGSDKLKRMGSVELGAFTKEEKNSYKILVGKCGNRPFWRLGVGRRITLKWFLYIMEL